MKRVRPSGPIHGHYFEHALEANKVGRVLRVHREFGCYRRCGDQKVDCPTTSRSASSADDRGVDASIRACRRCVKRDRIERRLGSLKAVLAACARSAGSVVAWGPAASSASVIVETAISVGSAFAEICSISMTADVSIRPRGCRRSDTGGHVLIEHGIYIGSEPVEVNRGSARKHGERDVGGNELSGNDRRQLSDRHAVAGNQKGLAAIQAAHDVAAGVA